MAKVQGLRARLRGAQECVNGVMANRDGDLLAALRWMRNAESSLAEARALIVDQLEAEGIDPNAEEATR